MPESSIKTASQPVHTIYGGAHLFKRTTCTRLGDLAQRSLEEYGRSPKALAKAMGIPKPLAQLVHERVTEKLVREPVEDYRIDFEDGYGFRPGEEEDSAADAAAAETAAALEAGTLSRCFGIRIKPLTTETKSRAMRTLDRYLKALSTHTGGKMPALLVTLPKVTRPKQVRALIDALEPFPTAQIEIMVETPQAVLRLAGLVEAAQGRCSGVHFGPYDYTASLGIAAAHQDLRHPACDFARSMMQVTLAGINDGPGGVTWSDGPTTTLPVPPHRPGKLAAGAALTEDQLAENKAVVHRAWKLHYSNVRSALTGGFYQGWDLHPAQLPARYAAVYTFFLEGVEQASARLRNFVDQAAQATRVGEVFDDAATGRGLVNYFQRAVDCGAIPEADVPAMTGLTLEELRSGSFAKIFDARRPPKL